MPSFHPRGLRILIYLSNFNSNDEWLWLCFDSFACRMCIILPSYGCNLRSEGRCRSGKFTVFSLISSYTLKNFCLGSLQCKTGSHIARTPQTAGCRSLKHPNMMHPGHSSASSLSFLYSRFARTRESASIWKYFGWSGNLRTSGPASCREQRLHREFTWKSSHLFN